MAYRYCVEVAGDGITVDTYNDCRRIFTSDHFTPERTERYRLLREEALAIEQRPFPENARRRYIVPMKSVAVTSFRVCFSSQEQFTLHGLSKFCARLMSACNQILEAERCTFHKMAWTFPYHLSFLSIGLYWVHIQNADGTSETNGFMGNAGLIALNPPYTNQRQFEKVLAALKPGHEYPIWWQYYCKAATLLGQDSFRSAVLESVIALEMALSTFVRRRLLDRGVSKSRLGDVKRDLTLSLMLNLELTSLAPEDAKPPSELVGRLNRARKLRNDIVHEGKAATIEEASAAVAAVREGLQYLAPLICDATLGDDDSNIGS